MKNREAGKTGDEERWERKGNVEFAHKYRLHYYNTPKTHVCLFLAGKN